MSRLSYPLCHQCQTRHHEAAICSSFTAGTSSLGSPPDPDECGRRVEPAVDPDTEPLERLHADGPLSCWWGFARRRLEAKP